jgi:hypothetical protein
LEILINELSKDKFEIEIKAEQQSKHFVSLSDDTHLNLSSNKISKKDLIEFSFLFLLDREPNTAIFSKFELIDISKYFPEYLDEVKTYCEG